LLKEARAEFIFTARIWRSLCDILRPANPFPDFIVTVQPLFCVRFRPVCSGRSHIVNCRQWICIWKDAQTDLRDIQILLRNYHTESSVALDKIINAVSTEKK